MKKLEKTPIQVQHINGELFLLARRVSGFRRVADPLVMLNASDFMNEDYQEMMIKLIYSNREERMLRL